jgi:hypothetical protein
MLMILALAVAAGCTKEGPAGPAGADGADGTDGTDGVDGNVSCLACHTQAYMDEIGSSFAMHNHSAGTSFGYAGTRESCAYCHSNDGFVEFARSGQKIAPAVATSLSCKACHNSHVSLEEGIEAPVYHFESVASVAVEGASYHFEAGNLCATCHQARTPHTAYYNDMAATYDRKFTGDDIAIYQAHGAIGPNGTMELIGDTLYVTFDVPTTHVYTSSTHAGPHHGPQANIIAADIGSSMGTAFEQDHHQCVNCHMHGEVSGAGHSFAPDINYCNECHAGAVDDIATTQTSIAERLHAVELALEDVGAIHVAEDGVHPMYASLPTEQWNAFWNYMCLWEDGSLGAHNFGYANQLLNQAESALGL